MRKITILTIVGFLFLVAIFFVDFAPIQNAEPGTKVVIIGGTSGIGEALAYEFAKREYIVGITGRRVHLLKSISEKIGKNIYSKPMDVTKPEEAQGALSELIEDMGGMDIIIINAGVSNRSLAWSEQRLIIDTNVLGFVAMAAKSTSYFVKKGHGHIVGVSSIAGLRGSAHAPAYAASKAFISNYLEGLRLRFDNKNTPIVITDIQPGLVDTSLVKDIKFPIKETPEDAAKQIVDAVERKAEQAYITKRWRLLAWVNKFMPGWLINPFMKFAQKVLN